MLQTLLPQFFSSQLLCPAPTPASASVPFTSFCSCSLLLLLSFSSLLSTLAPFLYCSSPAPHDSTHSIAFSLYLAIKSEVQPVKHSGNLNYMLTPPLCPLPLFPISFPTLPLLSRSPWPFINPTKKCDQLHLLASARIDATRRDSTRSNPCSLLSGLPICPLAVACVCAVIDMPLQGQQQGQTARQSQWQWQQQWLWQRQLWPHTL